ncbi:MAG: hypothetical protein HOF74_09325 [Gammaproteobacteria bacterium]|jgi:hypothetical protein|nr:hypothetical protein [Gammaproteobacteria bacterium]MBT3860017.1 hypothetical protein [Gammaproteobacteria bacterium]MBT3987033.1 hypothetical protein [Gammaproteobacteria bacterium]MBT4580702.1 hypothetical protein [Gammaproteobacteria bacterium]MBT4658637.1 hypothetical protein [Gammaproteobacteria bacterium]
MQKLSSILKILLSGLLLIAALATAVNLILLTMRPETISVVNALIGQGVIIIALLAFSRVMFRKGKAGLTSTGNPPENE